MRQRVLGKVEIWMDVGVERVHPLVLVEILDILHHILVCSVVEEDVDTTHLLDSLINDFPAVCAVLQICGKSIALGSLLLNQLLRLPSVILFLGQICYKTIGTLHGVKDCGCTTYARIAASNNSFLPFELASSLVELLAAIWGGQMVVLRLRIQFGLFPRNVVLLLNRRLVTWSTLMISIECNLSLLTLLELTLAGGHCWMRCLIKVNSNSIDRSFEQLEKMNAGGNNSLSFWGAV